MTPGARDARAAGLRYVRADEPGLSRRRAGRGFSYLDAAGRRIRSARERARIAALAIPPAWTDVWICADPDGHLQATGRDARGRRQYRYHKRFRARRDRDKFARLIRFGRAVPRIRRRVQADLRRAGLPRKKVIAAVVRLLEITRFRVGNAEYARLNRSFGLSTLRDRHARVSGARIRFRFRGKGGQVLERAVVDRRLATIVRRCQELPGQLLFQYVDPTGQAHGVSSEDVNDYVRDAAGVDEFTAKDFRTWAATIVAFRALRPGGGWAGSDDASRRTAVRSAVEETAAALGDTLAVARASYVHPAVIEAPAGSGKGARACRPRERLSRHVTTARPRPEASQPTRRDELEVLRFLADART